MIRRAAVVLLAGLAGCAELAPLPDAASLPKGAAWEMEGGNPARTSRSASPVPKSWTGTRLALLGDGGSKSEDFATPIVLGPVAYLGHSAKKVEAVRWEDGSPIWSFAMRGRVFGTLAYADRLLFAGDDEGHLVALSLEGKEAWRFRVQYPIVAPPVAAAGKVYVGVSDQNVFCLEASTGRPIWQYGRKLSRRPSQWRTPSLAWAENRLIAGFSDGTVVALDAEVGRVLWKAEIAKEGIFSDVVAGPTLDEGRVYAGALRGPVVCLDAASGKEIWRRELEVASGFAVGDGTLVAGSPSGKVTAFSAADGVKKWEAVVGEGIPGLAVLTGDTVVVGMQEGGLFALDAKNGTQRERFSGGSGLNGQPLVFEGGILFLSKRGGLYRVTSSR